MHAHTLTHTHHTDECSFLNVLLIINNSYTLVNTLPQMKRIQLPQMKRIQTHTHTHAHMHMHTHTHT